MQCCKDDPSTIHNDDFEDGSPLTAKYQTTGSTGNDLTAIMPTLTPGAGINGSKGLQSADTFDEISVRFHDDLDVCDHPRIEFAVGVWLDFSHEDFSPTDSGMMVIAIRAFVESDDEAILVVIRNGLDLAVTASSGDGGAEAMRVRNAVAPGTFRFYEIRGAINTFDGEGNANRDGWVEMRVNRHVYHSGEDVNTTDVLDPDRQRCPKDSITARWRSTAAGILSPNQGWDRCTIMPEGRADCWYIKERAEYCNEGAIDVTTDPAGAHACSAPGPGGSSFDGRAAGPRIIRPPR